jgi:hypothetical protein
MTALDKFRDDINARAKQQGWWLTPGKKLRASGRQNLLEALCGASVALDAVGHPECGRFTTAAFLVSCGRYEEFLNEVPIPTLAELHALSFPDNHVKDGPCAVCDEGAYGHEFPDTSSSVVCTNFARQVQALYPKITKVVGFYTCDNPVDHHEISACEGHDFAVVGGRYIVDFWLRDVVGDVGPCVFDMQDATSAESIKHRYGDRTKWKELT